jgi:predicted hydrocarbon binding protein
MYDIVKKLLFARELNLEKGKISLLGHTIIMAPVSSFIELRKKLSKIGATALLYKSCKESGLGYMNTIIKKFSMKKPRELLEWGMNTISLAGWGSVEIINFDEKNKRAIVRLNESEFARNYGNSKEPVDDVFRAYCAATGTIIFKIDIDVVEIKCLSMGNNTCEFIVKPAKEFDLSKKFIFKQLEITNKTIKKLLDKKL